MYIRPNFLTLVPDDLETEECSMRHCACEWLLYDIPDHLKTQEMCNEDIKKVPWLLFDVPARFRNLRMSIRAIYPLRFIPPGHPKTHGACESVVEKYP